MGLIKDKDKDELKKIFSTKLVNDCRIIMFTQENECPHCSSTREMLEELAALSDKIHLEVHDFVAEAEMAETYNIEKIPAVALIGDMDYGLRFYGLPGGYEFTTLVTDILDVSRRDPGLPDEVLAELKKVDKPVHLQAMALPT